MKYFLIVEYEHMPGLHVLDRYSNDCEFMKLFGEKLMDENLIESYQVCHTVGDTVTHETTKVSRSLTRIGKIQEELLASLHK